MKTLKNYAELFALLECINMNVHAGQLGTIYGLGSLSRRGFLCRKASLETRFHISASSSVVCHFFFDLNCRGKRIKISTQRGPE